MPSKKRKRDFEGDKISKHVRTLEDRNRNEARRPKTLHPDLQEASGLSSDDEIAEIEHSTSEEASISAFKRIRFDVGLQALANEDLVKLIDLKRDQVPYTDAQIRELLSKRKKWASGSRMGQEELYEAAEAVLNELISNTEHSRHFLSVVNKRDAPEYYHLIKRPMDLALKRFQYKSKRELLDDLDLIWANCLRSYLTSVVQPTHELSESVR